MASNGRWVPGQNFFEFTLELLNSFPAVPKVSTGPSVIEPCVDLVGEIRNELFVHHGRAFAEVRDVLAGMTARLGNEKPEVFHQIDPDRFFPVNIRTLDSFPDRRVEIFLASPEFEEKRLMIDPGAEEGDFVIRHVDPFGEHLAGSLNAVAKPDVRPTGCGVYRPAIGRHL